MQATLVQLSVPAITAAGGVLLLNKPISLQLLITNILILNNIYLTLIKKSIHNTTS